MHGPVHKSDLHYLYSINHFIRLPQEVAKEIINNFPQKVSYDSMKFDPVINEFNTNEVKSHMHICDNSIFTFGIRVTRLGFSKTSYVDSLYMFKNQLLIRSN